MKPKKCKGCGRPVRETAGGSGYCRKCIARARSEARKKAENGRHQESRDS